MVKLNIYIYIYIYIYMNVYKYFKYSLHDTLEA